MEPTEPSATATTQPRGLFLNSLALYSPPVMPPVCVCAMNACCRNNRIERLIIVSMKVMLYGTENGMFDRARLGLCNEAPYTMSITTKTLVQYLASLLYIYNSLYIYNRYTYNRRI